MNTTLLQRSSEVFEEFSRHLAYTNIFRQMTFLGVMLGLVRPSVCQFDTTA